MYRLHESLRKVGPLGCGSPKIVQSFRSFLKHDDRELHFNEAAFARPVVSFRSLFLISVPDQLSLSTL